MRSKVAVIERSSAVVRAPLVLNLADHLVCALVSGGIDAQLQVLVYATVKAQFEHLEQRRHVCYSPRLDSTCYSSVVLWHMYLGNREYFAYINLTLSCTIRRWIAKKRYFHFAFLSHERSKLAHRQMMVRSLSTARKYCLRFHTTACSKWIRAIFIVTRHIPALVHNARQLPYHTQFPALLTSSN